MAHEHSVQTDKQPWLMSYPVTQHPEPMNVPVYGPPALVGTAPSGTVAKDKVDDSKWQELIHQAIRQLHQTQFREHGSACDLMVLGEINTNSPEQTGLANLLSSSPSLSVSPATKACQNFSAFPHSPTNCKIINQGDGWIAIQYENINVVFVHVPNSIAGSESQLQQFYQGISNDVTGKTSGVIDLVMGDTNQSSSGVTPRVLSKVVGVKFEDAHDGHAIEIANAHNKTVFGTNAKGTKKYDVAVYNTQTLKVSEPSYCAPFVRFGQNAAAITDHMGLSVEAKRLALGTHS
jgi:hypothetical protein